MPFFSEDHKRRFTWKFGVIIAAAFVMQMVLPMAIMPLFMFSGGMTIEHPVEAYSFRGKTMVQMERRETSIKDGGGQEAGHGLEWTIEN